MGQDLAKVLEIAAAVFQAPDVLDLPGEVNDEWRGQDIARARRQVVEHDRESLGGVRYGPVMRFERLVVVAEKPRRHHAGGFGAGLRRMAGQVDRAGRVHAARVRDYVHPRADGLHYDLQQLFAFVEGHQHAFARGSRDKEAVYSLVGEELREACGSFKINLFPAFGERG